MVCNDPVQRVQHVQGGGGARVTCLVSESMRTLVRLPCTRVCESMRVCEYVTLMRTRVCVSPCVRLFIYYLPPWVC